MFYRELAKGAVTVSSHRTGGGCVDLALWAHGVSCSEGGDRGKLRGLCLFLLPWLKASLCQRLREELKPLRWAKVLVWAEVRAWHVLQLGCGWASAPDGLFPAPVQRASSNRGRGWDRGLLPWPWGKASLPALQRALPGAGCVASTRPSRLERRDEPRVSFCAGEGCWGWGGLEPCGLSVLVSGAWSWAGSVLGPVSRARGVQRAEQQGEGWLGSSRWEQEQRFARKLGAAGSEPQRGWWLGGRGVVCCSGAGDSLVGALKMDSDLIWKEPWVCAVRTMMLVRAVYGWAKVRRVFFVSSFLPLPVLFSLSALAGLTLSQYHQFNLQYFVCSFKSLPSWLWCLKRSQTSTWLHANAFQMGVYQYRLPDIC